MDTQETTTYHAVLIAAAVIGSIIIYFIISLIRQQRRHRLLYKAKLAAEINTLEKERARIAADLHDELGPTLSAAKFKLSSIESLVNHDEKMRADAIGYIDTILCQVRNIANGLMPNTLLRNGAFAAIEEFIDHMAANSNLHIRFSNTVNTEILQNYQVHIYRIVQEIVHNTIKHAVATELRVEIFTDKNKLIIAAADNGNGFSLNKINKQNSGQGINNLRNRVDLLSGEIHIKSNYRKGTQFLIEIPLTPSNE
jgi:signal transduction histidine kinase